jgi:hypothetical protein
MKQLESEAVLHRSFTLFFTCATLLWSTTGFAAPGELGDAAGNNANPHNLSSLSQNTIESTNSTEICVFCHTPHGATPKSTLWGRPDPANMGSFPTFDQTRVRDGSDVLGIAEATIVLSSKYGVNDANNEYPNGASKLCLSCHDGVTALGVTVRGVDLEVYGTVMPVGNSRINLATSHPISFYYTPAIVTNINALPKSATYTMPTTIPLDWDNRVQCTICHEPHKDTKEGTYTLPFWRTAGKFADQTADYNAICNECHTAGYYTPSDGRSHNIPVVP